ncbi:hypothetical protein [Streptomyces shenzhenensis]|uniref:hypothetical protein n=1 Tax=Streptomyces shenzhenensis TaxID=943815 RepID=UPI003685A7CB
MSAAPGALGPSPESGASDSVEADASADPSDAAESAAPAGAADPRPLGDVLVVPGEPAAPDPAEFDAPTASAEPGASAEPAAPGVPAASPESAAADPAESVEFDASTGAAV